MSERQAIRAMISAAESYSWLILKSIDTAISLDMDMDTCITIIKPWAEVRRTIVAELLKFGYCTF